MSERGAATSSASDVVCWRIGVDTEAYEAHDLNGVGAEKSGGRWNRKGTPMVYTATTQALACLETVVHLNSELLPLNRYLVEIRIPEDLWRERSVADSERLVGWDALPPGKVSIDWGTQWAASLATAVAEVPSVIVPDESNVLINPKHVEAARIVGRKLRRWLYDGRLVSPRTK